MLKVFLVEDESFIREGLRDNIPWEQYGYSFVGEASDGEMALPLIRKTKPDVLITDIKMPFMDGLELSKVVHAEYPQTKIIIISGHDDFEYARKAIEVGVEQYILKPITKLTLRKTLLELKDKMQQEAAVDDYQLQYQKEMKEYEQFSRRLFFEQLLHGELSVQKIYEEATKQSIDLSASSFNLMFFSLQDRPGLSTNEIEQNNYIKEELLHFFLRYPQYVPFSWSVNCYGILIKTEAEQMESYMEKALDRIQKICQEETKNFIWYVTIGNPVERLSMLADCYQKVNHYFAYRFILSDMHIFTEETLANQLADTENTDIKNVDSAQMDPEIIKDFLASGRISEIEDFVEGYMTKIKDALESRMFRDYVILNIRFAIMAYIDGHDNAEREMRKVLDGLEIKGNVSTEEIRAYFSKVLRGVLQIRDREHYSQSGHVLKQALAYIDAHFCEEGISLNEVAVEAGVSPNHLSSVFSQNMQKTFIEYITTKRMEKAKKLLKTTNIPSGNVAAEVGYKDPRYFSFVFKKTQGLSPREYRAKKQTT